MIKKSAIILLIFFWQLNVVSDIHEDSKSLAKFIDNKSVEQNVKYKNLNLNYYNDNSYLGSQYYFLPRKIDKNTSINIDSKSAIAFDTDTGSVLYSKNSNEKMPIASLTKIMTAIIVLENKKLNDVAIINRKSFMTEGRKSGLAVGEKIRVEDLLKMMMIESNNIAAMALAENTSGSVDKFVKLMNKKADSLGLKNTIFYNPTGLDQKNDNLSTTYDIARLVNYSFNYPIIWNYSKNKDLTVNSIDGKIKHKIKNTNLLLGKMHNIIGGKTGYTDEAGECLVLITRDLKENHQIITVVLNANDRFLQTEKLVKWTFKNYEW